MTEFSINIPASAFKMFEPEVQQAIMSYITTHLGITPKVIDSMSVERGRDDKGLAVLDVPEARAFLNNCSEKTTAILREIVRRDGDFMASDIADVMGTSTGELRGAWSGLTKRVRTIKKNTDAQLFGWFKQGGSDWQGIMAAKTVTSMRIALEERG